MRQLKPDHRKCPSHPTVSCLNLAKPEAESDFNLSSFVSVTRAKRQIFTTRLSVEKTSSTFPSKPELRDHPRRFRDEGWPAHIPER
jgi:hypothetical protein